MILLGGHDLGDSVKRMNKSPENIVTRWFGPHFQELHPLLQNLHRHGGSLQGVVEIQTGSGLAGWLGKRLASSLGIPVDRSLRGFEVEIRHTEKALEWRRRFDSGAMMFSRFEPFGRWPHGHWQENTGPLQMRLMVDVVNQSWQWRPTRLTVRGIRFPLFLMPQSKAGKRIEHGKYVFHVEFALPLIGTILSYGGALEAQALSTTIEL